MPTTFEYMQFATGVYAASDRNAIGDPAGWTLKEKNGNGARLRSPATSLP